MNDFSFFAPSRIDIGLDLRRQIVRSEIKGRLHNRAILVADPVVVELGAVSTVREAFDSIGVETIVYDEAGKNINSQGIEEISRLINSSRSQLVINVGDLVTLSAGRCGAFLASSGEYIDGILDSISTYRAPVPPGAIACIDVPVTYFNPLQLSDRCLVVDARNRLPQLIPTGLRTDTVLFNTALVSTLSEKESAYDLLSVVSACIENSSVYATDTLSADFIRLALDDAIEFLRAETAQKRAGPLRAGALASLAIRSKPPGPGGCLSYLLFGKTAMHPYWHTAILLPEIVRIICSHSVQSLSLLSTLFQKETGSEELSLEHVVEEVRSLVAYCDVPQRFRDIEIEESDLYAVVEVMEYFDAAQNGPYQIELAEMRDMLFQSL